MKRFTLLVALLAFTAASSMALTPDQVNALRKTLSKTTVPELGATIKKMISDATPADKAQVRAFALGYVARNKPGALQAVTASLPALPPGIEGHRPPTTPGNENGNRPTVPPGLNDYARP